MHISWTRRALVDSDRLRPFLAQHDRDAATKLAIRLDGAPKKLADYPRFGERVESYVVKEVRKLSIGRYVMHYEIAGDEILILRIWHSKEDRPFGEV